jgi:hypothetical protein
MKGKQPRFIGFAAGLLHGNSLRPDDQDATSKDGQGSTAYMFSLHLSVDSLPCFLSREKNGVSGGTLLHAHDS